MREILFRGKGLNTGKWIEGFYVYHINRTPSPIGDELRLDDEEHLIVKDAFSDWNMPRGIDCYHVDPKTVGQYTGLKDKNGKRIFEGDILAFLDTGEEGYEYKEGYDFTNVATVCWKNGRWELEDFGDYNSGVKDDMDDWHEDFIGVFPCSEVIGNIHDNPELIGGARNAAD